MSDDKKWINGVGIIAVPKAGGNLYIKIQKDIELKEGDRITLKKKEDSLREAFEAGRITQGRYEELLESQSWIKYELTRAPREENPKKK